VPGSGGSNRTSALDQRQYQLLFDTVPQGVIFHDADGRVIAMNPAAERILGRTPEDLSDGPSSSGHGTIREDGSPFPGAEHPSMVSMRAGREVSDVVMGVYNPREGEYRWISITAVPLFRPGEDRPYQVYTFFQDITWERRAEQALRELELSGQALEAVKAERKRLFDVLDTLPVMICLITPGYGITFANRAFRERFGETRGRRCYRHCFDQPGPCGICQTFKALETGRPHRWEVRQPDGSVIDVHDFPFRDADGSLMVLEMNVDVTEQRRAEEALKRSEAKYRGLFDSMAEAFELVELVYEGGRPVDYTFLDVNPAWEQMTGMRKEQVVGCKASEVLVPVGGHWPEAMHRAVTTGEVVHLEDYNPTMGKWYSVNIWRYGDGVCGATITDVTEIRRSQKEAEEQGRRLKLILDNTPVAIGITDERGGVVVDNGVLRRIWRGDPSLKGIIDYGRCRAWWPETGEPVRPEEWPAARALKGEASTATLDIERFDGSRGALIVSATPIKDADGRVTGTVWTNQDITDLRRTEQDLKRSNAELQQFAYVASHDLQEPLRMVTNYLQLIERRVGGDLDETSKTYMGFAVEGARRMKAMIDDILTYSRVESKGGGLDQVDMENVLSVVLKDLSLAISESGASITHDPLPTVMADRGQMVLLLKNLIGNAIKYRSEAAPQVHVSARRSDGEWVFSIEDNGIGIDPKYGDKLFKMFSRLHTRDEYPGTGMGLAIAKKIVERHGGRIWFESEPGMGSAFHFSIPLAR
jgi:PAS domain S-box-containing protein